MGIKTKWHSLQAALQKYQRVLVAFSGGCDSTFLLAAAVKTLGSQNVLAVTAVSPSLPEKEKQLTHDLADLLSARYEIVETRELNNPSYAANPSNRCYFCKDELFEHLTPVAKQNRMTLVDGFNTSDRADYRPGFQASQKWNVRHPLNETDLTKHDIRVLSRWMSLPTWNKPASPCLSSRIPYGTPVTVQILKQIEKAEDVVRSEGFSIVRVRHYGTEARIEVPLKEISRLIMPERWQRIERGVKASGYEVVIADPRGFESGRLNHFPNARAFDIS